MAELDEAIEAAMYVMYGDHPHAENYRAHVQLGVTAASELIVAATRREIAEEIARAIEAARGDRCPECGGKSGSSKALRSIPARIRMKCGGGHTWDVPGGLSAHPNQWCATDAAAIARGRGETDTKEQK